MTDHTKAITWPTLPKLNAQGQPLTPAEEALEELREIEKISGRAFPASDPASQSASDQLLRAEHGDETLPPAPVPIDVAAEKSAYAELMAFFRDNPEEDTKDFEALSEADFAKGLDTPVSTDSFT